MLIPYHKYLLISNYPKDIAIEKLNSITDKSVLIRTKNTSKLFEGKIEEHNFVLNRILNYRNSFYPIIHGDFITQNSNSTLIKIRMRLNLFATMFMSIWFLITGTILFFILSEQLALNEIDINSISIILGFSIIGYLMMIIGFNYEVKKSKKLLSENL